MMLMNYAQILDMESMDLISWLSNTFSVKMPQKISTIADMENASDLLLKLSSYYSYLCTLLSYAKVMVRNAKRNREKEEYEDLIDKKEIIQNKTDVVKQQYAAISRAVTIQIENNAELRMNTTGFIKGAAS